MTDTPGTEPTDEEPSERAEQRNTGAHAAIPAEPEAARPADEADAAKEPAAGDEPVGAPVEERPATSDLDAAVERASAIGEPDATASAETVPAPVPAGEVRRETYVPPTAPEAPAPEARATAAAALAAGAAGAPQAIYVQAPAAPRQKGNRGFGVLVALIGTVLYAALYAGVGYLLLLGQGDAGHAGDLVSQFVTRPVYWVPVAAFFVVFALLAAIVNRAGWWAYVVFGLVVAVGVYFSYVGGALLTVHAWTLTYEQAVKFVGERWLDPFAIVAAVIAREIPIWLGGWIARRGRAVTARNRAALEEYDRELAAGPQVQR